MSFPLYDSLKNETSSKDLTKAQIKDLTLKINEANKLHELIYMLIRTHYTNEEKTTSIIPYDGNRKGNDVEFVFDSFPMELKKILYRFISMNDVSEAKLN